MLPVAGDAPFDDPDWFFEPWWPGASTLAYVEDFRVRLQIEHLADPMAAFPELALDRRRSSPTTRLIVEGTLLVLDDEGQARRGPAARADWPSRARAHGDAALVASDLLYDRGEPLLELPFEERRARLGDVLTDGDRCVVSRGLRGEGTTLAEAVGSMGLTEISARLLSGRYRRRRA